VGRTRSRVLAGLFFLVAQENVAGFVDFDASKMRATGATFGFHRATPARAVDARHYARGGICGVLARYADVLLNEARTTKPLWPRRWLGHVSS
jgi:hypothetical protein